MADSFLIDNIANYNSLRDKNPILKVVFAVSSLIVSVISSSFLVPLLIALIMSMILIFFAKVPKKIYINLLLVPIFFGIFSFFLMIFLFGDVVWASFEVFGFKINILKDGFELGLLTFSKMVGGVCCTLFLALTTPFTEIFYILKKLKVPESFLEISMLTYRYIFVLLGDTIIMSHSQKTRLGYMGLKNCYRSLGLLMGSLLIKSLDKGDFIYTTLSSRGYSGNLMFFGEIPYPKTSYFVYLFGFEIFLVSLNYI
ncbi:cobalt ABC transporter, inner membrane subunit CbiQ [Methanococcus vannielii SB]|uniref:Cobalt ABC transporter, inner membrane subunit CbiQ n=1 Tax=Methanococcus vannielii (strain ATCC 35089 / DSM 1224 / JCM 13029 / OCM 148 / SB) TaxID=406327 RepID=A6UQC6_METVS|nr:cobalt ECF transporter T component CbiQ [Methanococcus vannielii]ABR54698.1 cobalt ABC transporter, inner membrane subunit CbiQ [Methanococcus vannielii SB]